MTSFEDNFLHHYQTLLFREKDADPHFTSSIRRKCVAVVFRASNTLVNNETTCNLLKAKLASYTELVDNTAGVNNYAQSVHALTSHCKTECQQWKSHFTDAESAFTELVKPPTCSKTISECQRSNLTEDDLKKYLCHANKTLEDSNHVETPTCVNREEGQTNNAKGAGNKSYFVPKQYSSYGTTTKEGGNQFDNQCGKTIPQQTNFMFASKPNNLPKEVPAAQSPWSDTTSYRRSINNHTTTPVLAVGKGVFHQESKEHPNEENVVLLYQNSKYEATKSELKFPAGHFSGLGPGLNVTNTFNRVKPQQMEQGNNFGTLQPQHLFRTARIPCPNLAQTFNRGKPQQVEDENDFGVQSVANTFRTAKDELRIQNQRKWGNKDVSNPGSSGYSSYGSTVQKRSLGARRGVLNKFVPPSRPGYEDECGGGMINRDKDPSNWDQDEPADERLKNIDPKMIELIRNEIMDCGAPVEWDDIAGLEFAKATIQEIVVWPLLRPEIFTGLRRPPKGILLFGPPGTGKTLIGKCIASQSCSTFFSISASSLTSKWIGDGEKMVRALFAVARCHQPAVVFIDEIDSLLSQRSDSEHESSRRIKTEFLVQLDGATTGEEDRILVIGATNRPQELDEAARRRLVKRLYIPLPEYEARHQIIERLMSNEHHNLNESDVDEISTSTDGYSGADMKNLCQEASLGPIRSIGFVAIKQITPDQVRPISVQDFKSALSRVRASVSPGDLDTYVMWDKQYGSGGVAIHQNKCLQ